MAVLHAGGPGLLPRPHEPGHRRVYHHLTQRVPELFQGDTAGAQKPRGHYRQIHDGGLHSHRAGASVHDAVNFAVHVLQHARRGGGAGPAGGVARRGGHRHVGGRQNGPANRVGWTAHPHGVQPGGHHVGHHAFPPEHHGQRPRPEALRQGVGRVRNVPAVAFQPVRRGDVQNQRVVLGPPLGREDVAHGVRVQAIGPQAVHRLCGDAQQAAPAENLRRLRRVPRL